jgi:hypothetical protein
MAGSDLGAIAFVGRSTVLLAAPTMPTVPVAPSVPGGLPRSRGPRVTTLVALAGAARQLSEVGPVDVHVLEMRLTLVRLDPLLLPRLRVRPHDGFHHSHFLRLRRVRVLAHDAVELIDVHINAIVKTSITHGGWQ